MPPIEYSVLRNNVPLFFIVCVLHLEKKVRDFSFFGNRYFQMLPNKVGYIHGHCFSHMLS